MLSQKFVFHKSKNFTSDNEIRMPPTVPLNHYSLPETNEIGQESYSVIPCYYIQAYARFEHSNFFKVTTVTKWR